MIHKYASECTKGNGAPLGFAFVDDLNKLGINDENEMRDADNYLINMVEKKKEFGDDKDYVVIYV